MAMRNLSPQQMFRMMAAEHTPSGRFQKGMDFRQWQRSVKPRVLAALGDMPEKVAPNPEPIASWRDGGLRRERWLIDVGKHISATLLINRPEGADGEKLPAILCCHGHGRYGKDIVMGYGAGEEFASETRRSNCDFGVTMAKRGYVTFAIDWMGFGDRNDNNKPNHLNNNYNRDWCNLYYLNATMFGMTSLGMNISHGIAAADFVRALDGVDGERMGVMGISSGGTMALWLALCDERFRAAEVICYSDLWEYFGIRDLNYCGMQVAPGLFKLVDVPDLQGLLAPRPLLADIGAYDDCFTLDSTMKCYRRVREIYEAAGCADRLELDLFPGGHGWGDNRSEQFFGKYLKY